MHKTLAPHRVVLRHRGEGHSEWFANTVHEMALRLLGQMPADQRTTRTARVVPLTMPAPPDDAVSIETTPQDKWWSVEDMLSRLALHFPMSIEHGREPSVLVHGLRRPCQGEVGALREAALDSDTYQSWHDGRPRAYLQTLGFEGDDLRLQFRSLTSIERWDGGPEIVWQIKGFLARLARQARLPRTSAGLQSDE
jgi:hypothetical protein